MLFIIHHEQLKNEAEHFGHNFITKIGIHAKKLSTLLVRDPTTSKKKLSIGSISAPTNNFNHR